MCSPGRTSRSWLHYSEQAAREAEGDPGRRSTPTPSWCSASRSWRCTIDRDARGRPGRAASDVATTLRLLVGGEEVTRPTRRRASSTRCACAPLPRVPDGRRRASQNITVPSAKLGQRARWTRWCASTRAIGPASINRIARQRQVTLTANIDAGRLAGGDHRRSSSRRSKALDMKPGYTRRAGRARARSWARRRRSFLLAFLLSIVFMYLILAAQFESWLHPITILLALPLTVPFALLSLLIFGQSLNIFCALGILVLFGDREEEQHPADRPHERPARAGDAARRGDPAGEPRPAAADPDDDARLRGRHDPAGALQRRRARRRTARSAS